MGNSFVLQEKAAIKIMKTDGKVLRYKAPMKVYQVLSEFPGHAVSDTLPVLRHLKPETKLLRDHVYHLVPLPLPSQKVGKEKKVRFAIPEGEEAVQESRAVRIKLVITKKELLEILEKGVDSVDEKVSERHSKSCCIGGAVESTGDDSCRGWMPVLESIPEAT